MFAFLLMLRTFILQLVTRRSFLLFNFKYSVWICRRDGNGGFLSVDGIDRHKDIKDRSVVVLNYVFILGFHCCKTPRLTDPVAAQEVAKKMLIHCVFLFLHRNGIDSRERAAIDTDGTIFIVYIYYNVRSIIIQDRIILYNVGF